MLGAIEALAFNTVTDKVSERPMAVPGPFFFEAPTETVGRRPCSHGGGPLRELDGQCPPSPIAGSPVPCSAPSGALRRNIKVCGHPSAPCAAASALRHWPPRRGAAGYGPPLLRGFGLPLRVTTPPGTQAPGSVGLGLSPPVPARRSAAVSAPHRLRTGLRPGSGSSGSLGPTAHPWAAPCGPAARPPRRCGFASGPSAPRRSGSPQDGPARALPSLVPRSVGRLGGLRAPLLPPGAWSGPAGRFFTAPAPGDGSRCSQGLASGFWLAQAGRLPPALCQLCQLILLASTGNLFVSYNGNG